MEPISHSEFESLRSRGELPARLEMARAIGNHQFDPFLVRQALLRTARRYYHEQGLPATEIDQRVPLPTPPPAWRGMPTVGQVKTFALLIDFADAPHTNAASTINTALFGAPPTGSPYESLAAYYRRASYGKLDFSGGATLGWYRVSKKRADVARDAAGRDALIKEALTAFDKQGHNFRAYDNDGDGVVDYFMVFWTGADTGWGSFWWGYQTRFSDPAFTVDGVRFGKYSWQWEARPAGAAFNPVVAIHETGHALGLPDLYDYDGSQGPAGGVGGADMMDANRYDHNAFSKWVLDWLTPVVVGSGQRTLALNSSGTAPECVAIWPGIDTDDIFSELFVVQNRQAEANDIALPASGLAVWHVDATLNATGTNYVSDNSWSPHKLVRLMEADGKEDIEANHGFDGGDLYRSGKNFGPATVPASTRYSGKASGVEVRDIIVTGKKITATFAVAPATVQQMSAISLAAAANLDGCIEVCAIGMDLGVYHIAQSIPNAGWKGWVRLGTSSDKARSLALGRNLDGRLETFAIGTDDGVYHAWQTTPNGGWSGWGRLGAAADRARSLVVASAADGRLELFAVGVDHGVYRLHQTAPNNGWGTWSRIGVPTDLAKGLAVARNRDGRLEIFAIGIDDGVYHCWQTAPNGGWSGWGRLGTAADRARFLAAASNLDGRIELFAVGADDGIYHIWQTAPNNGWSGWGRLGTATDRARSLAATRNLDGRIELCAVGLDDGIYHVWQTAPNNGWSGWGRLGTNANKATALALGNNKDGRIELLTVGTNSRTYHFWQTAPNNGWSAEGAL